MKPVTEKTARAIANALYVSRFERRSYDAKHMAQTNLTGKTHYADDDTLRFFHSRIVRCRIAHEGLVLAIVESVANDMRNTSRGFRFVAFDLFGTVLNDRDNLDQTRAKSDKAEKDMSEWLESFDVLTHYKGAMQHRAARLKLEAADMAKAARAIRA